MSVYTYDINNSLGFFKKFLEEREDFLKNPQSARHAINAALNGWHLYEWVYLEYSDNSFIKQHKELPDFRNYLLNESGCFFSELMGVADGSKHFTLNRGRHTVNSTRKIKNDEIGGLKGVKEGDLIIRSRMGEMPSVNILFDDVLYTVTSFWLGFFDKVLKEDISFFTNEKYTSL